MEIKRKGVEVVVHVERMTKMTETTRRKIVPKKRNTQKAKIIHLYF